MNEPLLRASPLVDPACRNPALPAKGGMGPGRSVRAIDGGGFDARRAGRAVACVEPPDNGPFAAGLRDLLTLRGRA